MPHRTTGEASGFVPLLGFLQERQGSVNNLASLSNNSGGFGL